MSGAEHGDWWRGAVIYQIYPRSFQDSDGDGVGDLRGIAQRLDHVARLGADAIWLSPIFPSPMKDFGYDVSDYCDIDPLFGTLADFDALVTRAHDLGLRVMIDLVLSHSSDQHPWFAESRASRDNPRADWYVWADPKPDGTPPNNWLSIFGGPAWTWEPRREQYYLHNFLASQPDLNFHNAAVQAALLDVARFWLRRGVDGFRLDTINFYFADKALRDNPPLPPEARNASIAPSVNPYNHQLHLYSKNRPENLDFLRKFRTVLDMFGAAAVGEVGDAQKGLELLGAYTSGGDKVQMCYAFELLSAEAPTAARIAQVMAEMDRLAPEGWATWAFSNHDVVRHVTRWGLSGPAARCYLMVLLCLRGSVCLYQGEELGLPEAELTFDQVQDPYGIAFWPEFKGRDGCRTPMVWDGTANGGFTNGTPWLPVPAAHLPLSVAAQEADPGSLLQFYRRALALRRLHPALVRGGMEEVAALGPVLRFRRSGARDILCLFNLGDAPARGDLPGQGWRVLDGQAGEMPGWGWCLAVEED